MYNGIGLQTVRGSGTNGYVQYNKVRGAIGSRMCVFMRFSFAHPLPLFFFPTSGSMQAYIRPRQKISYKERSTDDDRFKVRGVAVQLVSLRFFNCIGRARNMHTPSPLFSPCPLTNACLPTTHTTTTARADTGGQQGDYGAREEARHRNQGPRPHGRTGGQFVWCCFYSVVVVSGWPFNKVFSGRW